MDLKTKKLVLKTLELRRKENDELYNKFSQAMLESQQVILLTLEFLVRNLEAKK